MLDGSSGERSQNGIYGLWLWIGDYIKFMYLLFAFKTGNDSETTATPFMRCVLRGIS